MAASDAQDAKEWNKSAEIYAPFEAFTAQFTRAAAGILMEHLKSNVSAGKNSIRIMDAAAGTGASTFALAKCLAEYCQSTGQTAEVLATDFSEAMIKQLTAKLETPTSEPGDVQATQAAVKQNLLKVSASIADAQDLSAFADESLGAMTMSFGIMFPPSPTKVVKEIRRVLAPGGVAVICTWHYNALAIDLVPELAHALMGKPKFMEMFPEAMKFGQEGFMRRLFRGELEEDGESLFTDEDMEAKFVSGSATVEPKYIAGMLNNNPLSKHVGTWDEAAAEKYVAQKCAGDGTYKMQGTALMMVVHKR
mmetsp:Transcript_66592/g.124270  ORF Transcript_66592/g.124270 Transcript_66592/m.124270 type:complete len:307 (-) Transcript_66592:186-1106(-)